LAANVMVIYGVQSESPALLIPYLVIHVIYMVLIGICMILVICLLASTSGTSSYDHSYRDLDIDFHYEVQTANDATIGVAVSLLLGLAVSLCLVIWFFIVVKKARRFLLDKREFEYRQQLTMAANATGGRGNVV